MAEKITIGFQGGPLDGESRDLPKDHIPRVVETLAFNKPKQTAHVGRYELRYVFVGDTVSEDQFGK